MPIFNYICTKCGKESSLLFLPGIKEEAACTHCGSASLEKQVSKLNVGHARHEHTGAPCCGRKEPCDNTRGCCEK